MAPLAFYSLVSVVSVSLLLLGTCLLYGRHALGLTLYCAAIALWSGAMLLLEQPATALVGERLVASGAFVCAAFTHVAFDFSRQRSYRLVGLAYGVALLITAVGAVSPEVLHLGAARGPGPLFWPSMLAALGATSLPVWKLWRAHAHASALERRRLRLLGLSGALGFSGAWFNALALAYGDVEPSLLWVVLASLLLLAPTLRDGETQAGRRLLERSLVHTTVAALVSTLFFLGLLAWLEAHSPVSLAENPLGIAFVVAMAALALEPARRFLQHALSRRLLPHHAGADELATALALEEARADQAERLAELGQVAAAVAHELRNPLGVVLAEVHALERAGAPVESCEEIRRQLERAGAFVDDLLSYGRPRPLEVRAVDLGALVALGRSTATSGLGDAAAEVSWHGFEELGVLLIDGDPGQLAQVFVVLFENAALSLRGSKERICQVSVEPSAVGGKQVVIAVEDSGPGVPPELAERVFQPFVTGRPRDDAHPSTGLGLAIARSIVERHHGRLAVGRSELGGARFTVELPRVQGSAGSHARAVEERAPRRAPPVAGREVSA